MNPEDFEQALSRDIASLSRHDPTPAWKADILARATASPTGKVITFPRFILLAWAACWLVSIILHFMTPAPASDLLVRAGTQASPPADAEWRALESRREAMQSLLLASNESTSFSRP